MGIEGWEYPRFISDTAQIESGPLSRLSIFFHIRFFDPFRCYVTFYSSFKGGAQYKVHNAKLL